MNNPQYTQQQAQLLYDVLVHHSATTLAPSFDQTAAKELNDALSTLRMELSLFIADGYQGDMQEDSYDDDRHSQEWLDMH
jgi:hypothetical protein